MTHASGERGTGAGIHETVITFANRIRGLRSERGWSQARLALEAGMTPNHVTYLETGNGEPGMETLRRLAFAFGMTMSELIEGVN